MVLCSSRIIVALSQATMATRATAAMAIDNSSPPASAVMATSKFLIDRHEYFQALCDRQKRVRKVF